MSVYTYPSYDTFFVFYKLELLQTRILTSIFMCKNLHICHLDYKYLLITYDIQMEALLTSAPINMLRQLLSFVYNI